MKLTTDRFTGPVFVAEENIDGEIVPNYEGSGVLFEHHGGYYILSVSHVFDNFNSADGFHIPSGQEMINVNGVLHKDTAFDIAIFVIAPSDVQKFVNYSFLKESDIQHLHPNSDETCFISGYPFEKTSYVPGRSAIDFTHLFGDIEPHKAETQKKSTERHKYLFLQYPSDWSDRGLPHPRGLSGSGVWKRATSEAKLVGVNEYFDGTDCIRSIRVHLFVGILNHIFGLGLYDPKYTKFNFS